MSIRVYTGPHADRRRRRWVRWIPRLLAAAAIGAQIAWPLTSGQVRDYLTVSAVLAFTAACLTHAYLVRGLWWALGWFITSAGIGLAAEIVGVTTGLPFGSYLYADRLGPTVFAVPVVIGAAWATVSYPALLAARALVPRGPATALVGAWVVMAWDLFLDPQMVGEGYWTWLRGEPALPGIPSIPLQNFVGWLLVAFVVMLVLDRLPRDRRDGFVPPDAVPAMLLTWTFVSNIALALVIDPRPSVAVWGGVAMSLVVLPYLATVWSGRR